MPMPTEPTAPAHGGNASHSYSYSYEMEPHVPGTNTYAIDLFIYNDHPSVPMYMQSWESPAFFGEEGRIDQFVFPEEYLHNMIDGPILNTKLYFEPQVDSLDPDTSLDAFAYITADITDPRCMASSFTYVDLSGTFYCSYSSSVETLDDGYGGGVTKGTLTASCRENTDSGYPEGGKRPDYSYSYSYFDEEM
ncbi:unnamed protein product [Chrysoparadoxa australica]